MQQDLFIPKHNFLEQFFEFSQFFGSYGQTQIFRSFRASQIREARKANVSAKTQLAIRNLYLTML